MERLVAMMAFCEAPLELDGTVAPSGPASETGGGCSTVVAANKWPMQKLVATMAFCEAPFDGAFEYGTAAPSSSGAAGGSSASAANVPGEEDAAALRRAWLADAKEWPLREHRKAGTGFDGLAIFETVALQ